MAPCGEANLPASHGTCSREGHNSDANDNNDTSSCISGPISQTTWTKSLPYCPLSVKRPAQQLLPRSRM
eukprot:4159459-Amphidinium_carterae.1